MVWNETTSCCPTPIYIMRVVEFSSVVVGIPVFFFYCYMLISKKVFHTNLRVMLLLITLTDICIGCIRIPEIFDLSGAIQLGSTTDIIKKCMWMVSALCTCALSIERIIANLLFNCYENTCRGYPIYSLVAYSIQWAFSAFYYYLYFANVVDNIVYSSLNFVFVLFAFVLFVIVAIVTSNRYQWVIDNRFNSEYNEDMMRQRYQASENVRSYSVLRLYIPYYAVIILINTSLIVVLVSVVLPHYPTYYIFTQQIIYMTTTPRVLGCMFIVMFRHEVLNKRIREMFLRRKTTWKQLKIRNVRGVQLSFPAEREREMYFSALKAAWG